MADPEREMPPLVDTSDGASLSRAHFHESSSNISLVDSAAATLGSESVQDVSDGGPVSSTDSIDSGSEASTDDESPTEYVESSTKAVKQRMKKKEDELSSDEDWLEEASEISLQKIKCLFCADILSTAQSVFDHCKMAHNFGIGLLKKRHSMDQYSFIRLINFIRSSNPTPKEVIDHQKPVWEHDKFLKPVMEDDPLLMYDFDEEVGHEASGCPSIISSESAAGPGAIEPITYPHFNAVHVANAEEGHVTLTQSHFDHFHTALQRMQLVVDETNDALKQCQQDMNSMRKTMRHMVTDSFKDTVKMPEINCDDDEDDEDGYFTGYAHFSIHHDMLSDKARTDSYRDAIMFNCHLMENKIVLDLGCGTGILSMFCAQAGAAKVIGVDQSQIIFNAMAIIRENEMQDKIKLVRGRIEDVALVEPVVDVLVSEWMGYFLLFEGMLDSVIYARNKYLATDGIILPNACTISMMAVADSDRYAEVMGFWDNVYGLKMTSMKPEVLREASIETVGADKVISQMAVVLNLDLKTCHVQDTEFFTSFTLTISRDDQLTALAGSFDTTFNMDRTVTLSTSPFHTPTHWKQTVFYLPQPITVRSGQVLDCSIQVRRHRKGSRWLEVVLVVNGEKLKYSLS